MSLFTQPAIKPSEHGDLSTMTGEGCLPADIVFPQTESGFQDYTEVSQQTQVPLHFCAYYP